MVYFKRIETQKASFLYGIDQNGKRAVGTLVV
jgi:hypothetical protein